MSNAHYAIRSFCHLSKISVGVGVGHAEIASVSTIKYIDVSLRSKSELDKHITISCSNAFCHLYTFNHLRKLLTNDAVPTVVLAFITSNFDYCRFLICGMPQPLVDKLELG